MPFSVRAMIRIDNVVKTNGNVVYRGLYSYRRVSVKLFSQTSQTSKQEVGDRLACVAGGIVSVREINF